MSEKSSISVLKKRKNSPASVTTNSPSEVSTGTPSTMPMPTEPPGDSPAVHPSETSKSPTEPPGDSPTERPASTHSNSPADVPSKTTMSTEPTNDPSEPTSEDPLLIPKVMQRADDDVLLEEIIKAEEAEHAVPGAPIERPDNLAGRTFILDEDEDGERRRARVIQVVEGIDKHEQTVEKDPDRMQMLFDMGETRKNSCSPAMKFLTASGETMSKKMESSGP